MKIAIFGGTFNPVHKEHINIVRAAIKNLSLDRVIIMPSYITPNKEGKMIASSTDRINMCRLAYADLPNVTVSDYEIKKGGVSYSYITCNEFQKRYPSDERYLIIGGDMLENFSQWKKPNEILKCVKLAACAREDAEKLDAAEQKFKDNFGCDIVKFGYIGENVSSTKIRVLVALKEEFGKYLDKNTKKYILQSTMYGINGADSVKKMLSDKRWAHTVRVAVMAAENCGRLCISEQQAITAALFHDCAKELSLSDSRLKGFAVDENVPQTVIHQFAGAYLAERQFGIRNEEILNAIKYHTSGRENMSALEKLILLSDMLEEGRNFDGVEELRKAFYEDIDKALYLALKRQLTYLKERNQPIYYLTQKAFDYLEEQKL